MSADVRSNEGGEASIKKDEVLRIVLVGKTGSGKSATGNTILGSVEFESTIESESVTSSCQEARGLGGQVSVVDTPGLFDTRFSEDETVKKVSDCIELAAPGPHAFLLLINLRSRFTDEEQRSVEMIQKVFGQKSDEYTMILFTNSDSLEGKPVEDLLKKSPKLQALVSKCNGVYCVFNNKAEDPSPQVNELVEKINQMVLRNGGSHYTNEMFQEAARRIEEEKEKERKRVEKLDEQWRAEQNIGMREQKEKSAGNKKRKVTDRAVRVTAGATSAASLVGGTIGAALGAAEIGALTGTVGGPVGAAAGAVVGLGIGLGFYCYLQFRKRNTSDDKKPLID